MKIILKVVVYNVKEKIHDDELAFKKEEKISSIKTTTSSESIDKKSFFKLSEDKDKTFSDSMIGLHDQNESNVEEKENFKMNQDKSPTISDEEPLDDWSNDFGWNPVESVVPNSSIQTSQYTTNAAQNVESSASIISLAGSDITRFDGENTNRSPLMTQSLFSATIPNKVKYYIKEIDEISSEFDIKSMSIKKRDKPKDDQENLIESFLNEMQPSIQKQESKLTSDPKSSPNNSNLFFQGSSLNFQANSIQKASDPSWDCEDIVDIDNV
jgi:hypothetical protein